MDAAIAKKSSESNDSRVYIGVMGATGVGKSTFINLASGSNLRVGEGLESCTDKVHVSSLFDLYGRRVTLLDTPGFDDTNKSDTEILAVITSFLEELYRKGTRLAGVVYLHRISDFRMGGSSSRNFKLFCNLCGDDTLKNCVIVTNMWGEVDLKKGEMRERELGETFFKAAIDRGAKMVRNENTVQSAHDILRDVIRNNPLPLRIQVELVEEKKSLLETVAGAELNREMLEVTRKQEAEMRQLQEDMAEAIQMKDEVTRQELEEARRELQQKMDDMKRDAENLGSVHLKEKATFQTERPRNLAKDTENKVLKMKPTPHGDLPAEEYKLDVSQYERGKEVKQPRGRAQTMESIQRAAERQEPITMMPTVSLDEFKAVQNLLHSVLDNQAALERRVQQLEQDLRSYQQMERARCKEERQSSCAMQ